MLNYTKLKTYIQKHKKIISVYGLGNVGGPLTAVWLRAGAKVIGVDISKKLLSEIKGGISHKREPFISETFEKSLQNNNLFLTTDGIAASKKSHIKIIAVPVGLKQNKIDLTALRSVSKDIGQGLKKDDMVLISSSVAPGTTENIVLPILEQFSNLKGERDFFLIYNPERIFEGRAIQDIESNYPAVVAGLGLQSLEFGEVLLKIISKKGVLRMSSLVNAEAEKLFEGVYRDVNIALANELADLCEATKINYWETRKAANSQPFCHLHYPGTGVGGLCIPVYPRFIINTATQFGKSLHLVEFARKINDSMPKKCVSDAMNLLLKYKINPKKLKIAVLGLGFRGEVTDSRLSPTYTVVKEFLKQGCEVHVHDPYILEDNLLPLHVILSKDLNSVISKADLIFISTDHRMYSKLKEKSFVKAKHPLLIFDGRNMLDKNNFKNASLFTIGLR